MILGLLDQALLDATTWHPQILFKPRRSPTAAGPFALRIERVTIARRQLAASSCQRRLLHDLAAHVDHFPIALQRTQQLDQRTVRSYHEPVVPCPPGRLLAVHNRCQLREFAFDGDRLTEDRHHALATVARAGSVFLLVALRAARAAVAAEPELPALAANMLCHVLRGRLAYGRE